MPVRRLLLCVAVLIVCLPLRADGWGTMIRWPAGTIESGENLLSGHIHTGFPLTYLVDDDPATAWVFSGKGKPPFKDGNRYYIAIRLARPQQADELRIMNGYNKSQELFLRNDRVTEIRLKTDPWSEETIRKVALSDRMGWHSIRVPRQRYERLTVVFTKQVRGRDDDLCISGIELRDGGQKLEWHLPNWVLFDPGSDCGDDGHDWRLMSRAGIFGATPRLTNADAAAWSASGRYVAVLGTGRRKREALWVADADTGGVVYEWEGARPTYPGERDVRWTDGSHVEMTWYDGETDRILQQQRLTVR